MKDPVRVLQVIGAMDRGGAESLIMNIYRNIDREKLQFDFLVHERRKCDFDDEIMQLGGRLFRLPRFGGANYFLYRKLCSDFFEEHHDYSAVHVHIGSSAAMVIRAAKRYGLFCIAHSHNTNPPLSFLELGFRFFSRPTRHLADYYLACSKQAGLDRFGRAVVAGERFAVLSNGIELFKYSFDPAIRLSYRKALGLKRSEKAVCHIGRFSREKNHCFLAESFALALRRNPSLKLFLVGRGPIENEVRRLVVSLGISDRVIFLGVRDDVPQLLMGMDAFAFPSVWEGLGIAALEAQASGLPCLCSSEMPDVAFCAPYAKSEQPQNFEIWGDWMASIRPRIDSERLDGIGYVRAGGFDILDTVSSICTLYVNHTMGDS